MTRKWNFILLLNLLFLLGLTSCTFNPFTTDNNLSGNPTGVLVGGIAGAGGAALLGAPKSLIAVAGLGGAGIGYYFTTLQHAAAGVVYGKGEVYTVGDYATIEIPTDSIFEANSAELLAQAEPILTSAVAVLARFPNNNIMVSGSTSGFGTRKFQLKLSEARARQVAAFLWAHGVNAFKALDAAKPTRKLIYVGYGDYFPIANHIKANGIRANSRIQITAFPSKKQLALTPEQKVFANIGALHAEPIAQAAPTPDVSHAFNADLLPETAAVNHQDGFSENTTTEIPAAKEERDYFAEAADFKGDQNKVVNESHTLRGGKVVKHGGYKGEL